MSHPRAQRTVAPSHLVRPGAIPHIGSNDACILFAYAILAREAAMLADYRPQGENAPTAHAIHQLRVAARRLRVALRLFRRMLPSKAAAHLLAELRWFARSLGELRDLDVYAQAFKAYAQSLPPERRAQLSGYELFLRRERAAARVKAAAVFASARSAALFARLHKFVAAGPSASAVRRWRSVSVRDAALQSIRGSAGRVRRCAERLGERPQPRALHELRIKTKRLRYELEFFAEVYPQLKSTAAACKAVQDLLGAHQDACVADERLKRYTAMLRKQKAHGALSPALVDLRKSQLKVARELKRSFKRQWPGFAATLDAAHHAVA